MFFTSPKLSPSFSDLTSIKHLAGVQVVQYITLDDVQTIETMINNL